MTYSSVNHTSASGTLYFDLLGTTYVTNEGDAGAPAYKGNSLIGILHGSTLGDGVGAGLGCKYSKINAAGIDFASGNLL